MDNQTKICTITFKSGRQESLEVLKSFILSDTTFQFETGAGINGIETQIYFNTKDIESIKVESV